MLSHIVRSDWISVVFTIIDLAREFVRVYAAAAQPMSLVAQTDFTGELVVSNLKLGIIGGAAYHRHADGQDSGRWRQLLLPVSCPPGIKRAFFIVTGRQKLF